jgi:hypothetical protein
MAGKSRAFQARIQALAKSEASGGEMTTPRHWIELSYFGFGHIV